jgi:hypothetical protein
MPGFIAMERVQISCASRVHLGLLEPHDARRRWSTEGNGRQDHRLPFLQHVSGRLPPRLVNSYQFPWEIYYCFYPLCNYGMLMFKNIPSLFAGKCRGMALTMGDFPAEPPRLWCRRLRATIEDQCYDLPTQNQASDYC